MKQHPASPNHLHLIAEFAAMLDLQPERHLARVVSHNSNFGSVLASLICSDPSVEVFVDFPRFTRPRFSSAYLVAISNLMGLLQTSVVMPLEERFPYFFAIQKAFQAPSKLLPDGWQYGCDQSIPAHRLPSMTHWTAKALGLMPSTLRREPTVLDFRLTRREAMVQNFLRHEVSFVAPLNRCQHGVMCAAGETRSSICAQCLLSFPFWKAAEPTTQVVTLILEDGYQLCNDCGCLMVNGEHARTLTLRECFRRYTHLACRILVTDKDGNLKPLTRHEPLGKVSKSGKVYGTKLTTLDVQCEEDGDEDAVELKSEVEARVRADQCYERNMDECYDRSLQEVLDKRQSELVPAPVYSVDILTGKTKRGPACFFDGKPINARKGTKFCVVGRCRQNYYEAWKENEKR